MDTATSRRPFPLFGALFALFTVFTLTELWLLLVVTRATSIWFTIAFAILTGFLGSWMMKREGLAVFRRFREELGSGRFPAQTLAEGLVILIGAVLLITPGVMTDLIGISTTIPPVRRLYAGLIMKWAKGRVVHASPGFTTFTAGAPPAGNASPRDHQGHNESVREARQEAVDVEFREVK